MTVGASVYQGAMSTTPPVLPPHLEQAPALPTADVLATGCTPAELAAIEAAKGKPAQAPQPVRWGPLTPAALLVLRYLGKEDEAARQRLAALEAKEQGASAARYAELIEAVAGRAPPLLEGHDLAFRTEKATGAVYLVAVPHEPQKAPQS